MRADRLLSILMLLQTHGRMTARSLAEELDVSERTIYRDVEALCASGVPIYAEHGPGGGLALLDSYRTNLTGLNDDERRALFMISSVPGPLEILGASQALKSAMLKLSAALPQAARSAQDRQRFYLDWSWWFHAREPVPYLSEIQEAVWQDRRLLIRHRLFGYLPVELVVEPYALVAKAGAWYLVAAIQGGMRVYRVSWLFDAQMLEERFERWADFDLPAFWRQWSATYEETQQSFLVTLRVSPQLYDLLPLFFGARTAEIVSRAGQPDERGWVTLTIPFESLEAARERLLSFGSGAEVIEPEALRQSVIDYARQIVKFYEGLEERSGSVIQ